MANTERLLELFEYLRFRQPSRLVDHKDKCCCTARRWLLALDASLGSAHPATPTLATSLHWLTGIFHWGPNDWPISWCDAIARAELDCGAFAGLSAHILANRGHTTVPVQMIEMSTPEASAHWRKKWLDAACNTEWVFDDYIYHEGVGVVTENAELVVLDTTVGGVVMRGGYSDSARVVGLRIGFGDARVEREDILTWDGVELASGKWQIVDQLPCASAPSASIR